MKRSARMLAGLGFLFVAWARCGTDGAKCNGIWRKSGKVRADEKRTHAGDGRKQKLKKFEVAVEWRA
jgi:hypothetical protein